MDMLVGNNSSNSSVNMASRGRGGGNDIGHGHGGGRDCGRGGGRWGDIPPGYHRYVDGGALRDSPNIQL
jgi:hypothetical protein